MEKPLSIRLIIKHKSEISENHGTTKIKDKSPYLNTKTRHKRDSSALCFSSSELIFKDGDVLIKQVLRVF